MWGVRQSGKSTLLKERYPTAFYVDLLRGNEYVKYSHEPHRLQEELAERDDQFSSRVVIDEIQRVPHLLNEVHWLIENTPVDFALCCSNARKLRRAGVNLLGGRALRYRMFGISAFELGADFDLTQVLNIGYTPRLFGAKNWREYLDTYVNDYVTTEVAQEADLRNLPNFSDFLRSAALADTGIVNFTNVAADCGVAVNTVKNYYDILIDAMHGDWLPSYRTRAKRRIVRSPKFYFTDVGVVNMLAKRNQIEPESAVFGHAFENWVMHELRTYNEYARLHKQFSYWQLSSGSGVDFIVGNMEVAIEAKASNRISNRHLKGLRNLRRDHPEVKQQVVVSLTERSYKTDDEILVLSVQDFVQRLWDGGILETF